MIRSPATSHRGRRDHRSVAKHFAPSRTIDAPPRRQSPSTRPGSQPPVSSATLPCRMRDFAACLHWRTVAGVKATLAVS
jgi:hypothetical protein